MATLFTEVHEGALGVKCSLNDKITLLGSCFADNIGEKMQCGGFDVMVNPFGTLFNPASIAGAVHRLDSGEPFTEKDCVEMGAGAGRICSFEHHTRFARKSAEEFLHDANERLDAARKHWASTGKVIITLGTAFVWEHRSHGIVANCLKRDGREFTRRMLDIRQCSDCLLEIVRAHSEKQFIFTVSPVRHPGQGVHGGTISKATLHLAVDEVVASSEGCSYFPAWEIVCDELRDYRFYGEDLLHPSPTAISIVWERFLQSAVPAGELQQIAANEKAARMSSHRPLL